MIAVGQSRKGRTSQKSYFFPNHLIQERVKAGLRNAKAKGRRIGRPKSKVDSAEVLKLRDEGLSWRAISDRMQLGLGTVFRAVQCHEVESGERGNT